MGYVLSKIWIPVRLDFIEGEDLSFMRICVCIKEAMNRFICDMLKNIPKLLENY